MTNSFTARLQEVRFMESFNAVFDNFIAEQVVRLMCDSFAARLEQARSMKLFNALSDILVLSRSSP